MKLQYVVTDYQFEGNWYGILLKKARNFNAFSMSGHLHVKFQSSHSPLLDLSSDNKKTVAHSPQNNREIRVQVSADFTQRNKTG